MRSGVDDKKVLKNVKFVIPLNGGVSSLTAFSCTTSVSDILVFYDPDYIIIAHCVTDLTRSGLLRT